MNADTFIKRWDASTRNETANSKPHFVDLCTLLDVPLPTDDPTGAVYAFEKQVAKANGRKGWADVWFKGHFGWEYKSKGRDLEAARDQLLRYAGALENPPLLVTSDMARIVVRTNFTNTVTQTTQIDLEALRDASTRDRLRDCWLAPDRWRPGTTRQALTERAAGDFAELAERLRKRGHAAEAVAHFVNRLVFCLFANDVRLLPNGMLGELLALAQKEPDSFADSASMLFRAMSERGGRIGFRPVPWFNGGLFDDDATLPLTADDIALLNKAATNDWSQVDPSIFGTLFERGLDPSKRSQLGAHYTDRAKIELLIDAVVARPLAAEWVVAKRQIATAMLARAALVREMREAVTMPALTLAGADAITAETQAARKALRLGADRRTRKLSALLDEAQGTYRAFLVRLRAFRVLDPACGSGNFLYVSLLTLKDLELRASVEAEALGLEPQLPEVGPEAVLGIEVNPYAAELARVSVWIGHIQWARRHGLPAPADPVLRRLDTIECRDALIGCDGSEASWPTADAIVGNPPFLGDKLMAGALGREYVDKLRKIYKGQVPGAADLVMHWFSKAGSCLAAGPTKRFGFVATNSVRQATNRSVIANIQRHFEVFDAWSDEFWINDGASVQVSLICIRVRGDGEGCRLDGDPVEAIYADMTPASIDKAEDFTKVRRLKENIGNSFFGLCLAGKFSVEEDIARQWLTEPNPHARPNSDVLRPLRNGADLTDRPRGRWVIDFGTNMTEGAAALYEKPFEHVLAHVAPERKANNRAARARHWWRHGETRPAMRKRLHGLERYICTPERAKHRFFVFLPASIAPEHRLVVFPFDSPIMLGILSSRYHVTWAMRLGSTLEDRPGYNTRVCFDTFPFPAGFAPTDLVNAEEHSESHAHHIAEAAERLDDLRQKYLNPPELVLTGTVNGSPGHIIPIDKAAASVLKKRTMTGLYNARPAWLNHAHKALDEAVALAYGWPPGISDDDALKRLFALNQERAKNL